MNQEGISPRQLYIIYIVALLSPVAAVLPKWTVATGGRGAWLTGLVAVVPMAGVLWLWGQLVRPRVGLSQVFQETLGKMGGKALTIVYMVWVIFLLAVAANAYGQRMLSAGYEKGSLTLFLVVMLGLTLWMGRKKLAAFARMAELLYLVLVVTLAVVLIFALMDGKAAYVLPVTLTDGAGIMAAGLVPCALLSTGVLGGFLWGGVTERENTGRQALGWLLGLGLVMTLVQLGVIAVLGQGLAGRMTQPFIELSRGIGVAGAFQRLEDLVAAIWLFSDFGLLTLLLFAGRRMAEDVFGAHGRQWAPWVLVILAFLGGRYNFIAGDWAPTFLLGSGLVMGVVVPFAVWLVLIWGRKREAPNI